MPFHINQLTTRGKKPSAILAIFAILIVGLACGFPIGGDPTPRQPEILPSPTLPLPPPPPTATPNPLPPGLVESDPPVRAEVPSKGPITLFFNQPMERSSVESALASQMQQELTFTWVDDTTVIVYFNEELSPDSKLALELGDSVRSRQGLPLMRPISLNFRTAGFLATVQVLPEDNSSDVDPSSAVVAAFNRPVVPLGADQATLPAGFTLDPESAGRGIWLNTSTYVFYPEPALAGGVTYTVSLNPELKSSDGMPLRESYAWNFTTALPKLLGVEPSTEIPWPLDPNIVLSFNQPMDRTSVETEFFVAFPDGRPVEGMFKWEEDDTRMVFTPSAQLPRSTTFNLSLGSQTRSAGGTALGADLSAMVITVPELSISGSEPAQGGTIGTYDGIGLSFTSPLPSNQDLLPYITMQPAVSNLQATADQSSLAIYGSFSPNTDYLLKVAPTLTDQWGGALGEEFQLSFRTSPLQPNVSILTGADAIFLTPEDISLILQAVNVPEIPLTVGSVPLNDLYDLLGPNGYELRQNYQGENSFSLTQQVDLPPNETQAVQVFLTQDQQSLPSGIYFVRLNYSQDQGSTLANIYPGPYLIVVSNVQLTFKFSPTNALVWAVDLRTGLPLPNAPVTLAGEDGTSFAAGITDDDGIFRAEFEPRQDPYSPVYAVLGQPGQETFGMAFSSWTSGIEPWDFQIETNPQPPGLTLYMYTDRPIYRPGQTVYFRLVARQAYNGRYSPPQISSLPITIFGTEGRELKTMELPLSAMGTAHGEFGLPEDAQPGNYSINSSAAQNTSLNFQVANYRKPEINLAVQFTQEQVKAGEKIEAIINARYFFDSPAGDLPVKWALYTKDEYYSLPGYQVGPADLSWMNAYRLPYFGQSLGEMVSQGEASTDSDGILTLEFPTDLNDSTQRYSLEVTVQDESGLPVSGRSSTLVHPDSFYIGLRPDAWVGSAGSLIGFDVYTADWQQKPVQEIRLRAEFQRVVFERSEPVSGDPFQMPGYTPKYTPIGSTDFSTGPDGLARVAFTPPDPGTYMLDVYNPAASEGEGSRTQLLLWIGGSGEAIWPNLPNSRIRLTSDKAAYKPGETAQVFIPNPFGSEVTALLTFERSMIMYDRILQVEAEGTNLFLPLTDEEAPNFVVSVTLIGRNERGNPDFRQGFLNLSVEPVEQKLNVTLLTEPEKTGPGDDVQIDLLVSDSEGKPVEGEFSLSVVDLAVLALAEPNSKDILSAFYGEQPSGVRTSLSLAVHNRRLLDMPGGMGGGGDTQATTVTRESFPDTAYWNAEIMTGPDGKATVKIALPDTLTTWQVEARGLTQETLVGEAESQIITSKDLVVRPVTQRFFVADDHAQVAAVIQNNSSQELNVQISLQAEGFVLDDPTRQDQDAILPAEGRLRVEWWGTVEQADEVDLLFSAVGIDPTGRQYTDSVRPPLGILPVLRYDAPQTYRTAGTMENADAVHELVSLPRSYSPSGGELVVELSPSLAAGMIRSLDALETASFDSTEQILSSFLPNLEIFRTLDAFGIQDEELETRLDRNLNDGLVRILDRQNFDGGWSWWDGDDSDAYISAYVLFGLQQARLAGVTINQNAIDQAVSYLKGAALPVSNLSEQSDGLSIESWQWDRLAFEQFVLTQLDSANPVIVDQILQENQRLNPWAQAFLLLTLENLSPGSEDAARLLTNLEEQAIRSATGAYWELGQDEEGLRPGNPNMQTNLSNTAIVLYALAQYDPGSPLAADAVRFLMANRDADGSWIATYTTAWTLIALDQVLASTGELSGSFDFSAEVNGSPIAEGTAGGDDQLNPVVTSVPIQRLYPDYPNTLTIEREAGTGRLYYTAGLNVHRPVEEAAPLSQGLVIERNIFPFTDECKRTDCDPIHTGSAGDKVTVRLTLILPRDMYYLAVSDAIPAGAEILDTSLQTTQIGVEGEPESGPIFNPRHPFSKGFGWWLFSQPKIFDDHISWTATTLPAGSYQLTYTLTLLQAGQYHLLPARAFQLYFPEVQANSAGSIFEIKP